eukprot:TRINITY_DN17659_c0_g1_i1.p1 TRINITY_DN17659_c0_g1~~TRINITY_DN17659_c0_g1_i1.p1  ORF type:complete len:232 (+),score=40.31 TRINITY_DN17659_c0_g1_i1:246-941(+)
MRNIASFRNSHTINTRTVNDVVRFLELRRVGITDRQAYAMVNSRISAFKPQKFASEYDQRAKATLAVRKLLNKHIKSIKRESLARGLEEYKRKANCSQEIVDTVNKELQHYAKIEILSAKLPDPEASKKADKLLPSAERKAHNINREIPKKKNSFNHVKNKAISRVRHYEEMEKIENIAQNKKEHLNMLKEQLLRLGKTPAKLVTVVCSLILGFACMFECIEVTVKGEDAF